MVVVYKEQVQDGFDLKFSKEINTFVKNLK